VTDWKHRNKLLFVPYSVLLFAMLRVVITCIIREHHCAAAISNRVISAACVSITVLQILNVAFDYCIYLLLGTSLPDPH